MGMLGRSQLCILTIGLMLAEASPGFAKDENQQSNAQQSIAKSLNEIAIAQSQGAERAQQPNRETELCIRGKDLRYSDLCAQWKAADAASDSAWWAWAGGIIGLGSLVGVFAAIALAYHANWIARDTARRQLRAYIGVELCSIERVADSAEFVLTAQLKNCGQTPAYEVQLMGESFADSYPLEDERPFLRELSPCVTLKEGLYNMHENESPHPSPVS